MFSLLYSGSFVSDIFPDVCIYVYVYIYILSYILTCLLTYLLTRSLTCLLTSPRSRLTQRSRITYEYPKTWSYPREHASHRPLLSRLYEDEQTPGPLKKCRVATGYRGTGTFQAEFAARNFGNTWVEEIPLVRDFPEREIRLPRT